MEKVTFYTSLEESVWIVMNNMYLTSEINFLLDKNFSMRDNFVTFLIFRVVVLTTWILWIKNELDWMLSKILKYESMRKS